MSKYWLFGLILGWIFLPSNARPPEEGMWLPLLLNSLNESDMQARGLRLSAEEIYSVNQSSMKDAVFSFGGFCTASVISDEGLLLTNHHCAAGIIQSHSKVSNDLMQKGFWARNRAQEIPTPGLSVSRIVRMEDVTQQVLGGLRPNMSRYERTQAIREATGRLQIEAVAGTHFTARVEPFFYGSEYYLFVIETFKDVRLVGAPPVSIGRFGGDTDNWMWPRHTGDFALFRIYADSANHPQDFGLQNQPLKPAYHFPISLSGYKQGDFTMVYGFPGKTQNYLNSAAITEITQAQLPLKINLYKTQIKILSDATRQNPELSAKVSARVNFLKNQLKKWENEQQEFTLSGVFLRKSNGEKAFQEWVTTKNGASRTDLYLLKKIEQIHRKQRNQLAFRDIMHEGFFQIPIIRFAYEFQGIVELAAAGEIPQPALQARAESLKKVARAHFRDFAGAIDQQNLAAMIGIALAKLPPARQPEFLQKFAGKDRDWTQRQCNKMVEKSLLASEWKLQKCLDKFSPRQARKVQQDPIYQIMWEWVDFFDRKVATRLKRNEDDLEQLNRQYLSLLREKDGEKKFYPDANATLRLSYGAITPIYAPNGEPSQWFTTLDGLMQKAATRSADYALPPGLIDLYEQKDFGPYAENGQIRVCFIATNHTSQGNSGSPVIDGYGRLIGINFDRNQEGTISDILYDEERVRNISVDIRYILFLIDKYAGAEYLLSEMTLLD